MNVECQVLSGEWWVWNGYCWMVCVKCCLMMSVNVKYWLFSVEDGISVGEYNFQAWIWIQLYLSQHFFGEYKYICVDNFWQIQIKGYLGPIV